MPQPRSPRQAYIFAFILITLFVPLRWVVIRRNFSGVFHEATSLVFHLVDLGLLMLFALWLWRRGPSENVAPLSQPLLRWLIALTGWVGVSVSWALDTTLALQYLLQLLILLAFYALIQQLEPPTSWITIGLAASIILQSLIAILSFLLQDDLGLQLLGEIELDRYPGGGSIIATADEYWLRAYGLTNHPNILGGFLAMGCLVIIGAALSDQSRRGLWVVAGGLGSAALVLSFSRSAWLGFSIGFLFLALALLWRRREVVTSRSFVLVTVSILIGGLLTAIPTRGLILSRFIPQANQFEVRSLSERGTLQEETLAIYELVPLTGVGVGNATVAVAPFVMDLPNVSPQPIHNVPLLQLVEMGPAGAAIWLGLIFYPIFFTLNRLRSEPERVTPWLLALTAALITYAVIDMYDYYGWGWAQGRYWRWLLFSLWALAAR